MELSNEFEVEIPVAEAWSVLTDVERIAPCLPGAQLQEIDGDEFRGIVKVKVGPIVAQYKGKARFVELDEEGRRAILTASGRDTRGHGNANATITAELTEGGDATHVSIVTDLMLTGRVAQFGRGVLADVSAKLVDQFVENLDASLQASRREEGGEPDVPAARPVDHPEPEYIDLVDSAGGPVLKRLVPVVIAALGVVFVLRLVRRRRHTRD